MKTATKQERLKMKYQHRIHTLVHQDRQLSNDLMIVFEQYINDVAEVKREIRRERKAERETAKNHTIKNRSQPRKLGASNRKMRKKLGNFGLWKSQPSQQIVRAVAYGTGKAWRWLLSGI